MPTLESARQKRGTVLQQIAEARYAFPNEEYPDREVALNFPERRLGVQVLSSGGRTSGWLYPDIVVTDEPGHFIAMAADLALAHEITNETAIERWAPLAKAAPLVLYVPMGQAGRTMRLCRLNGIKLYRLLTYRQRPAGFGIDLQEAYSGPDLFKPIAALLPGALKPMAYRDERKRVVDAYLQPLPASRSGDVPALAQAVTDAPATLALPSGMEAEEHAADGHGSNADHLPPPSLAPILFALGLISTATGAIFVTEMLSVGITLIVLSAVRWFMEDMGYYEAGGPAEFRQHPLAVMPASSPPPGVHMPPPSLAPIIFAAGLILTAAGAVFTTAALGAGITLIIFGGVGWFFEDISAFEEPAHDDEHHDAEDAPVMAGGNSSAS